MDEWTRGKRQPPPLGGNREGRWTRGHGGRGSGELGLVHSGPDPGSASQSAFFTWGSHADAEPRVCVHHSAVVASPAGHEGPLTGGSALERQSVEAGEGGPRKKTFSLGT